MKRARAYEFLDTTTDLMFKEIIRMNAGIEIALQFYEYTLSAPKFKAQRYHFQHMMFIWNCAFTYGYFNKQRNKLHPSLKAKLYDKD